MATATRLIDLTLVNGLAGDPAVFGFFPRTGDAVLFDAGELYRLVKRDLLKVRLVLVSHTHIDHFIGFDQLLRVNVPHFRTIEVVGPLGILKNVQGKLRGYRWNLLEPGQVRFVVRELAVDGALRSHLLTNETGYTATPVANPGLTLSKLDDPYPARPAACVAALADGTRFDAVALDHGTPSLAYVCKMPVRLHVDAAVLERLGLKPGAWIRELQIAFAQRELAKDFNVEGRSFTAAALGEAIFKVNVPKPVAYLTDVGFTKKNLALAATLFRKAEKLVCETNFKDAEYLRAREKMHLTTRQAALIAAHAEVSSLDVFHVSNIYANDPKAVRDEALRYFEALRSLPRDALWRATEQELARP